MRKNKEEEYGITKDLLLDLFIYKEGKFINKKTRGSRAKKNLIAGNLQTNINGKKYFQICINYHSFKLHRLVYMYHYGSIPYDKEIDHINQNSLDNHIENLRLVSRQENSRNMAMKKNNTTGYTGVSKIKDGKFKVRIRGENNKRLTLGTFNTAEEASEVYQQKAKELGFHENHGKRKKEVV